MTEAAQKPRGRRLTNEEVEQLKRDVNFLAILEEDGLKITGDPCRGECRGQRDGEQSAGLVVSPPGHGAYPETWTWMDHRAGMDRAANVLDYLTGKHGVGRSMPYANALKDLMERTGQWVEGWEPLTDAENEEASKTREPLVVKKQELPPVEPPISEDAQAYAVGAVLEAAEVVNGRAAAIGAEYLASRGCLPAGAWSPENPRGIPLAWAMLEPGMEDKVTAILKQDPRRDEIDKAGMFNDKARLLWWAPSIFLPFHTPDARPVYLTARRTNWKPEDRAGKYINQRTSAGNANATRYPWGLPAIYRHARWFQPAPEKAGELLIVEGIADALAATCMGWPALSTHARPRAAADVEARTGDAQRIFSPHLPALRSFDRVRIMPDADPGEKGAVGRELAGNLVGWMRARGIHAEIVHLEDVVPAIPEGAKDLADISAAKIL